MGGLLLAIAASATLAVSQAPARPVEASPALWVVRDDDTTIYLFGTFHALDGRSNWFNGEVWNAFAHSDELILETVLPRPDSVSFGPAPRNIAGGIRGYSGRSSANFLGATRMAVKAGRAQGLKVEKGADSVLRRAAEDSGKSIGGLESPEFQFDLLRNMAAPPPRPGDPVEMDHSAPVRIANIMGQMQAAWNRGDQGIFVSMLDEMRERSPDNYRLMFPQRNAQWAGWIADRLDRPGTVFVAVGAGHFAGSDSVLSMLGAKGLSASRLN